MEKPNQRRNLSCGRYLKFEREYPLKKAGSFWWPQCMLILFWSPKIKPKQCDSCVKKHCNKILLKDLGTVLIPLAMETALRKFHQLTHLKEPWRVIPNLLHQWDLICLRKKKFFFICTGLQNYIDPTIRICSILPLPSWFFGPKIDDCFSDFSGSMVGDYSFTISWI